MLLLDELYWANSLHVMSRVDGVDSIRTPTCWESDDRSMSALGDRQLAHLFLLTLANGRSPSEETVHPPTMSSSGMW
jgi:hypothetical protein